MAKKQCSVGWGCGGTCISRKKTCKSNLGPDGKVLVENFSQYIAKLRPEGGAAGAIKERDRKAKEAEEQSNRENEAAKKVPKDLAPAEGLTARLLERLENRPEGGARGAIRLAQGLDKKPGESVDLNIPEEDRFEAFGQTINLRELAEQSQGESLRDDVTELIMQEVKDTDASDLGAVLDELYNDAASNGFEVNKNVGAAAASILGIDVSDFSDEDFTPNKPKEGWGENSDIPKDLFTNSKFVGNGAFGIFVNHEGDGYKIEAANQYSDANIEDVKRSAEIQNKAFEAGIAPRIDSVQEGPQGTIITKMEILDGYDTVEDVLKNTVEGKEPQDVDRDLLVNLSDKVQEIYDKMHDLGISHNDFHSGNVLYNPETGDVKIIDFGLSELSDNPEETNTAWRNIRDEIELLDEKLL